jgi:hypothetical protein
MQIQGNIFLCDYRVGRDHHRLYAALDELTLTYDIVQHELGGRPRPLRRHVRSLRDARQWACAYCSRRARDRGHDERDANEREAKAGRAA